MIDRMFSVLDLIKEVLSLDEEIQKLATELYQQKSVLIMGRGYHYATCLEGALVRMHFNTHFSLPLYVYPSTSLSFMVAFVYIQYR